MTRHDDTVLLERDGPLNIIRLNRPEKKNAITRAMYDLMAHGLEIGENAEAVRVHVIVGGPGAFSSGNDMQDFATAATSGQAMGGEVVSFLKCLATLQKPVVSGVDGLAIGIGTTIHMHCDLTIATPNSLFRTPFVDLALVPEAGSSLLAPAAMGYQRAFAMLALGKGFSAVEARDAGLIWAIEEPEQLEEAVLALARDLAGKPPVALKLARKLLRGDPTQLLERIESEAAHFRDQLTSQEARAAFTAFLARNRT